MHALGGDLPRDDEARLRALYVDLLALPASGGRPLVVVLDGLDEALETLRPSPAMFPRALGDGVHVVFSARQTAGRDWLANLDLQLGDEACIDLGRLGQADIAEILERAGLASHADIAATLAQKTNGDPFYVADVLADALQGRWQGRGARRVAGDALGLSERLVERGGQARRPAGIRGPHGHAGRVALALGRA